MNGFKYNPDIQQRDTMLFGKYNPDYYAKEREQMPGYTDLSVEGVRVLMYLKYINPNGTHNGSPLYKEFVTFMERHPEYKAVGSISSSAMAIDGVTKDGPVSSQEELDDIIATFPDPDIVRVDTSHDDDGNIITDAQVIIYYEHIDYDEL